MEPPVPFPNTEVKRPSADDTEGATLCGKYATARGLLTFKRGCFIIGKEWLADLKNSRSELGGFSP